MTPPPEKPDDYWKKCYWDMIYRRGLPYEVHWHRLNELNYKQAAVLMEFSQCYRVVGNTVYLDSLKLKRFILERHNERSKQDRGTVERPTVYSSKYL